jgi:hypothetical protein
MEFVTKGPYKMRKVLFQGLLIVLPVLVFGQSASEKYEPGTILAVKPHGSTDSSSSATAYDISIRVSNTVYTVLYIPPPGTYGAEYSAGNVLLVLINNSTITYNDILGRSRQVRILNRRPANNDGR